MANRFLAREEITLSDGTIVDGQPVVIAASEVLNDDSGVAQLGATEIAPAAAGEQFVIRSVKDGAAALFVNEGQEGYADAVTPATLASEIHIPHLPVYADHATAQGSTVLEVGQAYAISTVGEIGVKLT